MRKQVWTRMLSLVLALALVVTAMPELLQCTVAAAETALSAAGQQLGTLGDTVALGEWLYSADEKGQAVIKGYTNTEETSLSVPYVIGGNVVIGIADGAFAELIALEFVTLSSYVTEIGDGVFGENTGVTIKAYSGSRALKYAADRGYASVNLTNANSTVHTFADGVIDMAGFSGSAYRVNGTTSLIVDSQIASLIRLGDIVYVPAASKVEELFAGEVSEKKENADGVELCLSMPEDLSKILTSSNFDNLLFEIDPSTIRTAPGVTLLNDEVQGAMTWTD